MDLSNVRLKKNLYIFILILGVLLIVPVVHSSHAQNATIEKNRPFHSDKDVSPIEGVIMINEDKNKTVFFQPSIVTIRAGGEILIANNATSDHSVTSGSGPDDPMAGKFFNTDKIKPRGFVEYVPNNLTPGNYSFYSSNDPQIKGKLVVVNPNK